MRRYQPMHRSMGTRVPTAVRYAVLERDSRQCVGTLLGMPGDHFGGLELDHVEPGGMGKKGPSTVQALVTLCSTHHRERTENGRKWRPLIREYIAACENGKSA